MNHFFVTPEAIKGKSVFIEGSDVDHISKALRLGAGDKITVADGRGNKYLLELLGVKEDLVRGEIIKEWDEEVEPRLNITLCQGLPKSKKMDLVVQKTTELGVNKVIPVTMKRSVVKLKPAKAKRRVKRWEKIALEAAKQSRRASTPQVEQLIDFEQALELVKDYDLALVPWVDEKKRSLKEVITRYNKDEIRDIIVFVGPEGGFSKAEIEAVREQEIETVSFGPRTLRTETASIFAVGTLIYEFES